GVVFGGRARIGCGHRGQVERLPRRGLGAGRVDQTVAAHPHRIRRLRKVGYQVASLVVGHDDADELGRQVVGFGDDPDARFRTVRTRDGTGDVGCADGDTLGSEGPRGKVRGETDDYHMDEAASNRAHIASGYLLNPWKYFVPPLPKGEGDRG